MIEVKIVSQVSIPPITEDVIKELIRAEILRNNPTLFVTDIAFETKLKPARHIVANVTAALSVGCDVDSGANVPSAELPSAIDSAIYAGVKTDVDAQIDTEATTDVDEIDTESTDYVEESADESPEPTGSLFDSPSQEEA